MNAIKKYPRKLLAFQLWVNKYEAQKYQFETLSHSCVQIVLYINLF